MEISMEFKINSYLRVSRDTSTSAEGRCIGLATSSSGYTQYMTIADAQELVRAIQTLCGDGLEELKNPPKVGRIPLAIPGQPDPSRDSHSAWDA
jgi:hypothetical protein